MTMYWSFSCNSFLKFYGKNIWSHNMTMFYPYLWYMYNEVYKEIALYILNWEICPFKMEKITYSPIGIIQNIGLTTMSGNICVMKCVN